MNLGSNHMCICYFFKSYSDAFTGHNLSWKCAIWSLGEPTGFQLSLGSMQTASTCEDIDLVPFICRMWDALLSMNYFWLRLLNSFAWDLCNDEKTLSLAWTLYYEWLTSYVKCLCYVHDLLVIRSNARALH
jgi:hypothetical protein